MVVVRVCVSYPHTNTLQSSKGPGMVSWRGWVRVMVRVRVRVRVAFVAKRNTC